MTMWVFGYGSLIWNPGFETQERVIARLPGYARTFCMRSVHYRGTPESPGLVLALDQYEGHVCEGVALRVSDEAQDEVLAYLRERELVSYAYKEMRLQVILADGRIEEAISYVVDPDHVQYCGGLDLEEQARIIATAQGEKGPNHEYLINTQSHLTELGIHDPEIDWLARRVRVML
ncbi:gamma-glutamylcyclotransferase [Rhodobacteraceae bacterium D3-12]|nr:gamma-glutamylcyclotransferase [Rhodobacteraceae bacterium D3-12]